MRPAPRFAAAPREQVLGRLVPVACERRLRLLGLAFLDRELAGPGLWIPGCRSIHTFGMRFELEVVFLDRAGNVARHLQRVPPRRIACCRHAAGVLELAAPVGESYWRRRGV